MNLSSIIDNQIRNSSKKGEQQNTFDNVIPFTLFDTQKAIQKKRK